MRVLVDTTFARRGPSGTAIYVERLIAALRTLGVDVVEASNDRRRPPAGGGVASVANLVEDRRWTALELPRRARECRAEVIHHPLPAHAARADAPQVVTVHDLAFLRLPECFEPAYRRYSAWAHRAAARAAGAVVCVSETTALDVRARWAIPAERVVVAAHGPGQEPIAGPRREERHFLYVGDDEPRKNLGTLLAAYSRYREEAEEPKPLVLAGRVERLDRAAARAGLPRGVELVRGPDPARLTELFAQAIALVHPALHEGFGLTPLEAMHAGVPVLAARSPGLTETCGLAVAYADPRDRADFARGLLEMDRNPARRVELALAGSERAREFSWERSARAHVAAYTLARDR